jgi:RND family efflux transporter MFP subunit
MGKTKSGRVVIASAWLLAIAPAGHAESFDCVIKPSMLLKIGSPVSTTLQTVEVDRGQHIARDQIIARLESKVQAADVALDEARASNTADVMSHQARLAFAEAEDSRGERLLEGNNIPRQKVDELRTNLRVAQEDLRIAASNHQLQELETDRSRALLEQRTIRSPIDGIVVQRLLGPGEFVHQDSPIVELAQVDPLYVEAYPPVRAVSSIKEGMTGTVRPDVPLGQTFQASVTIVDHVFDAASGTFGIRLSLANPNGALSAGLRCTVSFDGDNEAGSEPSAQPVR